MGLSPLAFLLCLIRYESQANDSGSKLLRRIGNRHPGLRDSSLNKSLGVGGWRVAVSLDC
jgi:hypothetical protein